jgi:hypothetical protein
MATRALRSLLVGLSVAAGCSGSSPRDSAVMTLSQVAEPGAPGTAAATEAKPKWRRGAVECRSGSIRPSLLAGVTAAMPLDAIEIRRGRRPEDPGELLDARGDVCGTLDERQCDAARRRSAPPEGFLYQCDPGSCFHYLLLRQGDRIEAAARLGDLLRLLAPIDTEHDALLLAWASGSHVACDGGQLDGEIERTSSGFRYTTETITSLCPPVTSRIVIDVTREGVVSEVSRRTVRQGSGCIHI